MQAQGTTTHAHEKAHALHERAPSPHPEDVDPLGRAHSTRSADEHAIIRTLAFCLVAIVIAVPIIAAISAAPTLNVLFGLSPVIITLALGIAATGQHYRHTILWYLLLVVHIIGLALLWLVNLTLSIPLNVGASTVLSLLIGAVAIGIAMIVGSRAPARVEHVHHHHTVEHEFHTEKLVEYVHSMEDKVKGLNFAIGRVYRRSNGSSDTIRERLRISREWYNEFYAIKPEDLDEQKVKARILVHKIHDRLKLLAAKEREVFTEKELAALKNLARNKNGEDAIIDVLKTNDRDPVEHYYVGALEVCETILKGLGS